MPPNFDSFYLHHYIIRYRISGVKQITRLPEDYLKSVLSSAIKITYGDNSSLGNVLFATKYKDPFNNSTGYRDAPPPYIIRNAQPRKKSYTDGEVFSFELILMGDTNKKLQQIFDALKVMAVEMSDAKANRFEWMSMHEMDERGLTYLLADAKSKKVTKPTHPISLSSFSKSILKQEQLTFQYLSPTRLSTDYDDLRGFNFFQIVFQLTVRAQLLAHIYTGAPVKPLDEISEWCQPAMKVKPLSIELKNHSYLRKGGHIVDGFTGAITYSGKFNYYLPLLLMGQWLHVGKNASLGCGQYKLEFT